MSRLVRSLGVYRGARASISIRQAEGFLKTLWYRIAGALIVGGGGGDSSTVANQRETLIPWLGEGLANHIWDYLRSFNSTKTLELCHKWVRRNLSISRNPGRRQPRMDSCHVQKPSNRWGLGFQKTLPRKTLRGEMQGHTHRLGACGGGWNFPPASPDRGGENQRRVYPSYQSVR